MEIALQLSRRDGISETGVATAMSASDLTNGAFYWHFESKEKLVRDALVEAHGTRRRRIDRCRSMSVGGVEAVIRDCLSSHHVANAAAGCAYSLHGHLMTKAWPRHSCERIEDGCCIARHRTRADSPDSQCRLGSNSNA